MSALILRPGGSPFWGVVRIRVVFGGISVIGTDRYANKGMKGKPPRPKI